MIKPRLLLVGLAPAAQLVILSGPFVQIGVAQLGLPASLVGGLVALQMATAILRPWLGRFSDRLRSGGPGRMALLRGALLVQWSLLPFMLVGLVQLGEAWASPVAWVRWLTLAGEAALILALGTMNQLAQTVQAALLLDSRPPQDRPAVLRHLWLCLNGFILMASLLSGAVLLPLAGLTLPLQLLAIWGFWAVVLLLILTPALRGGPSVFPAQEPDRTGAESPQPRQQLDRTMLLVLLLAHAPLYCQEILLDPWATRLFGWSLASSTTLTGFWAIGTLIGQSCALRGPWQSHRTCLLVAVLYGLMGLKGVWPGLAFLPIPVLVIGLGLASGGLQLWLAGQMGLRCGHDRLGETFGWLSAAVVLSRTAGVAVAGPLLDGSGALFGVQSPGAFGLAFSAVASLALAGAWSCRRMVRTQRL